VKIEGRAHAEQHRHVELLRLAGHPQGLPGLAEAHPEQVGAAPFRSLAGLLLAGGQRAEGGAIGPGDEQPGNRAPSRWGQLLGDALPAAVEEVSTGTTRARPCSQAASMKTGPRQAFCGKGLPTRRDMITGITPSGSVMPEPFSAAATSGLRWAWNEQRWSRRSRRNAPCPSWTRWSRRPSATERSGNAHFDRAKRDSFVSSRRHEGIG